MRFLSPLLIFMIFTIDLVAQDAPCGTQLSHKQSELLKSLNVNKSIRNARQLVSLRQVAVSAHVVKKSDGTFGLSDAELDQAIADLNFYYNNAGINFFVAVKNEILNSAYYDFKTIDESDLGQTYDVPNTLNIYFVNTVYDAQAGYLCGYAYFPDGPDHVIMQNICATNGSTLIHEIGHYFTLIHTHGKSNTELTDELVNGSNCATAGDEICDTPADPYISEVNVNTSCQYFGTKRDANNQLYTPDPSNIMSYSRKDCRDHLTAGQYDRVWAGFEQFRTYLYDRNVVANFEANINEPCVGTVVTFTETSLNAQSVKWEFEGGTPATSTNRTPHVVYDSEGQYSVKLYVDGANGEQDTLIHQAYISVVPYAASELISVSASFESELLEQIINNPDGSKTFEVTTRSAAQGDKSIMMNFYDYANEGASDYLIFPQMDNTFSRKYTLSFDYAYSYYDDTYFDELAIVYRSVCSAEWIAIWDKSGSELATTTPKSDDFIPEPGDWKHIDLALQMGKNIDQFEWAFKATNGYGNNLYIDNIEIVPTVEVVKTNPLCPDLDAGKIEVITTGSRNYSFSLNGGTPSASPVFIDLAAGNYLVNVQDELGRVFHTQITIQPNNLSYSLKSVSCYDSQNGSISFSVSGNTSGLVYQLDGKSTLGNKIDSLAAGQHVLEIRAMDQSCVSQLSFMINRPDSLVTEAEVEDALCANTTGRITFHTSGGTGLYTYQFNDENFKYGSAFNLAVGDYKTTVKDANGCLSTSNFSISGPDSLKLDYQVEGFLCPKNPGGTVLLSAVGGVGDYAYALDGNQLEEHVGKLLATGTHQVSVKDANGCITKSTINIDYLYETPEAPVIYQFGDSLVIDDPEAEIRWYRNGEELTDTTRSISYEIGFEYIVGVSYGDGQCEVFSEPFILLAARDLTRHLDEIGVFPVPVEDRLVINIGTTLERSFVQVKAFTMSGEIVDCWTEKDHLVNWKPGVYLIEILGEGWIERRLVIKN